MGYRNKYNGRGKNRGNGGSSSALDSAVLDPRPEDRVREECTDTLEKLGFGVWRIEPNAKRGADCGLADTIIRHPKHGDAMVEFKAPYVRAADSELGEKQSGGRQRPDQIRFQKEWEAKGGAYLLVDSHDTLLDLLQQYGVIDP
jgi:hypothetical protein